MGRPEIPLDPSSGPLAEFAWDLRKLRTAAGKPTYRQLSRKAGYSSTALSAAAAGRQLPSLDVTLAFVGSCGGDTRAWEERWHRLAAQSRDGSPAGYASGQRPDATARDAVGTPFLTSPPASFGRPVSVPDRTISVSGRSSNSGPGLALAPASALTLALALALALVPALAPVLASTRLEDQSRRRSGSDGHRRTHRSACHRATGLATCDRSPFSVVRR